MCTHIYIYNIIFIYIHMYVYIYIYISAQMPLPASSNIFCAKPRLEKKNNSSGRRAEGIHDSPKIRFGRAFDRCPHIEGLHFGRLILGENSHVLLVKLAREEVE